MFLPVDSSVLRAIAYDTATQTLWIQFRSLALYCYSAVPATVYQELLQAPSKGIYFNRHIRAVYPSLPLCHP